MSWRNTGSSVESNVRVILARVMMARCVLVAGGAVVEAQTGPNLEIGLKPYGSYQSAQIDTINLSNGNVDLRIPLISYPQLGSLRLDFFIQTGSKDWTIDTAASSTSNDPFSPNQPEPHSCDPSEGGWERGHGRAVAVLLR